MNWLLHTLPGRILIALIILWILYQFGFFDSLWKPDCSVNPGDVLKGCKNG